MKTFSKVNYILLIQQLTLCRYVTYDYNQYLDGDEKIKIKALLSLYSGIFNRILSNSFNFYFIWGLQS